MGNQDGQIRGWKDIASAAGTSVRSARRWEHTRGLPVRRHAGERDAVYMLRAEFNEWLKATPAEEIGTPAEQPQARNGTEQRPAVSAHAITPPPEALVSVAPVRTWRLLIAGVAVFFAVTAAVLWGTHLLRGSGKTELAPLTVESFNLRLSRPDGWKAVVTIADGGAGQFAGLPGQPTVVLRPRRVPAGLMLEIARADGRPVTDRPDAPGPPVLLLERNVPVGVREPFRFDVEWVTAPKRSNLPDR